jgi:hypothetical protein
MSMKFNKLIYYEIKKIKLNNYKVQLSFANSFYNFNQTKSIFHTIQSVL